MTSAPRPAASPADPLYGAPVLAPGETVASIGDTLAGAVATSGGRGWRIAAGLAALLLIAVGLRAGLAGSSFGGAGGWWLGLSAGCLSMSGLLLLAGVEWRCGIGRLTQTVAVLAAGMAMLLPPPVHPIGLAALLIVSAGLWVVAALPDAAALRDRLAVSESGSGAGLRRRFYRRIAHGWHGSALQWLVWERACRGLALVGIVAALAVLIDLALAPEERFDRHDTLRPVALLVEAVLAAAALTAALAAMLKESRGLGGLITGRHLDILGRLILAFGLAALYCHITGMVTAFLYGDAAERSVLADRLSGAAALSFRVLMVAGLLPTQLFWIGAVRRSAPALGLIGAMVAAGLRADHGPAPGRALALDAGLGVGHGGWEGGWPGGWQGVWELVGFLGSLGLFALALLLIFRLVPPVSIAETRQLALTRHPRAALPAPDRAPSGRADTLAVFASEAGLAEAARGLLVLDRPPGLEAFGPAPMPEAAATLRRSEERLGRFGCAGAFLAAGGFLALWRAGPAVFTWASIAGPALSAAAIGATLGLVAALVPALRRAPDPAPLPGSFADRFVLALTPTAGSPDPTVLARRLRGLPEAAGRPLAVYGPAPPEPRR